MTSERVLDCLKELEIRLGSGETLNQAKQNGIYIEDLTDQERAVVDNAVLGGKDI